MSLRRLSTVCQQAVHFVRWVIFPLDRRGRVAICLSRHATINDPPDPTAAASAGPLSLPGAALHPRHQASDFLPGYWGWAAQGCRVDASTHVPPAISAPGHAAARRDGAVDRAAQRDGRLMGPRLITPAEVERALFRNAHREIAGRPKSTLRTPAISQVSEDDSVTSRRIPGRPRRYPSNAARQRAYRARRRAQA